MEEKKLLRKNIIEQRKNINQIQINNISTAIINKIISNSLYQQAKNIMFYIALSGEINLEKLIIQTLKDNKTVSVPYLHESYGLMDAAIINDIVDLTLGKFNIMMPKKETLKIINPEDLDIIFIPGLAYDENGNRLGFGGGYYDRFLPKCLNANFIGIISDEYILNEIPKENHDILLNYLASESGIFKCKKGRM